MIFANTQAVADIAGKVEGSDTVLLSMRGVSNIDISCAQTLRELVEGLRKKRCGRCHLRYDHPRNENDGPY